MLENELNMSRIQTIGAGTATTRGVHSQSDDNQLIETP